MILYTSFSIEILLVSLIEKFLRKEEHKIYKT
jgi:hypothetical protein